MRNGIGGSYFTVNKNCSVGHGGAGGTATAEVENIYLEGRNMSYEAIKEMIRVYDRDLDHIRKSIVRIAESLQQDCSEESYVDTFVTRLQNADDFIHEAQNELLLLLAK